MPSQEEQYKTGFNQGYILAEHKPSLSDEILKQALPDNHYFEGFKDGKSQFDVDRRDKNKQHDTDKSKPEKNPDIIPSKSNADKKPLHDR